MQNNYDDYVEGSIFDMDEECKPMGLVKKKGKHKMTMIVFCISISIFSYILYYTIRDLYKD
jgi:hypothetical protein